MKLKDMTLPDISNIQNLSWDERSENSLKLFLFYCEKDPIYSEIDVPSILLGSNESKENDQVNIRKLYHFLQSEIVKMEKENIEPLQKFVKLYFGVDDIRVILTFDFELEPGEKFLTILKESKLLEASITADAKLRGKDLELDLAQYLARDRLCELFIRMWRELNQKCGLSRVRQLGNYDSSFAYNHVVEANDRIKALLPKAPPSAPTLALSDLLFAYKEQAENIKGLNIGKTLEEQICDKKEANAKCS